MAINTKATLEAQVVAYMQRSDLASQVGTFTELATARFNEVLRVPQMEVLVTTTMTDEWTELPSDFLGMRYIETSAGKRLTFVTPEQFALYVEKDRRLDPPIYTIADMSFRVFPAPTSSTVELLYWQRIPALTNASDTNWLLEAFPQAYLAACLCEGYQFLQDDERAMKWDAKAERAIGAIRRMGSHISTGASTMTIRTA